MDINLKVLQNNCGGICHKISPKKVTDVYNIYIYIYIYIYTSYNHAHSLTYSIQCTVYSVYILCILYVNILWMYYETHLVTCEYNSYSTIITKVTTR